MPRQPSIAEWVVEHRLPDVDVAALRPVELTMFRALGHEVARRLGGSTRPRGRFIDEPMPGICMSHHRALLALQEQTTRLLLHHELPLLAFAVHSQDRGYYEFVDDPRLAEALGPAFVVLPKSVLDEGCDVSLLNRETCEAYDLRYWNPPRLGDALFNFWD